VSRESTISEEEREAALAARVHGFTLSEVAQVLGLSIEGTRKLLEREARAQVDLLHARLVAVGSIELTLPFVGGEQLEDGLAHIRWVVHELRLRGLEFSVYISARGDDLVVGLTHQEAQ
jgi:hypothetical protein